MLSRKSIKETGLTELQGYNSKMSTESPRDLAAYLSASKFPKHLEAAYQDEFFNTSLRTHRIAIWTGIIVFLIFELLDLGMPPDVLRGVTIIRLGVVIPILLWLFAFSYMPFYKPHYNWAASLGLLVTGVGVMAVQVVVDPPGFTLFIVSLVIIIISAYTLARLRYRSAVITGWTLFGIYIFIAVGLAADNNLLNLLMSAVFLGVSNFIGMVSAYFSEQYLRRDFIQRRLLEQERERSEKLLLNILPTPVAERLKRGDLIADSFEDASVLFADIVDFTLWSGRQTPEQVLSTLNIIFSKFDALVDSYGLEKIKTIGDAYMVVSGVPTPRPDHLTLLANLALDFQKTIHELPEIAEHNFQIRIGIQCGPVVAGVIGSKKFIYDLWGDTVNTASRLEASGAPGRIQVSQDVYQRLKDTFSFEERGQVSLKGKGDVQAYWLVEKKA